MHSKQSLLFSLLILIVYIPLKSCLNKSLNIGLTPIFNVRATFNSCLKCNTDSNVNRILDSSTVVPFDVSCNGFIYNQMSYYYQMYMKSKQELVAINQMNSFSAFLNGNSLSILNGYISNGTCTGDYIYSVGFSIADDQNGCYRDKGVRELNVIWNMYQIIGKCSSLCYGRGVTTLSPAISNKGKVYLM